MKVVEQVIGKWLNRLLGGFVEEIDSNSINVAMLAGTAVLDNLTVKPTCMQELGLPVVLNAGTVGRIELDIPMGSLKSKPICVMIRDVLISVSPNQHVNLKKVQLDKHLFDWDRQGMDDTDIDPHSKLGRLLAKVADNIKITIENVHLRFEDTISSQPSWHRDKHTFTDRCFTMGFTLDRFVLEGCVLAADGTWEARSVREQLRFLNKTVSIGTTAQEMSEEDRRLVRTSHPAGFGMYLHDHEMPMQSAGQPERMQEWIAEMRGYIAHADYDTSNAWLFGPVSLSSKISLDKNSEDEFRPCSSRIWTEDAIPEEDFHMSDIGTADELHVEVSVTEEQLQAASGHFLQLHWAFETAKDGIGFGVSLLHGVEDRTVSDGDGGEEDPIMQSAVSIQWAGKGVFQQAHMELCVGSMLSFRDQKGGTEIALASVVGAEIASPKNPRKGHPFSVRIDLPSPDTRGFSKYICSLETKELCTEWIEGIKAAASSAVKLPEDVPPSRSRQAPQNAATGLARGQDQDQDQDRDDPQMLTIEALQQCDSHLQRVHGHARIHIPGVYVLYWGNALTKTRGRSLRHAVWLQQVSKSGRRSVKVQCKMHRRQINPKWSDSPAAKAGIKPTTPVHNPKDRKRASLDPPSSPGDSKSSAARRLDDVHRDASHGARKEIELVVGAVPININHAAMRNIVAMQVWYSNISRWQRLQHLRPSGPDSADVTNCPRAWWVFAIKAVILESTDIFKTLSRFVKGSREYAELFKRKYAAGRAWLEPLSKNDEARIAELEEVLPVEMILKRRTAAWLQLHQEDQAKDHKKRDLVEMEAELVKIPVEAWIGKGDPKLRAMRKKDRVVYTGMLLSDQKEKKALSKSRFIAVVDVKSLHDTHHSGWMLLRQRRTDAKEVWDRYWFRLKGQSLFYFVGTEEDKPRREIHLSTVSHVQIVSGSETSLEIVTKDRKFLCKCDRPQDCTAWTEAFTQCFARAGDPRDFYRWLLVFKGNSPGTKPLSVVPLTSRCYTWKAPSVAVRDCEQSAKTLCVGMLDFSVRQWLLAHKDESQFRKFDDVLAPNAAELLNDDSLTTDKTTLSANQQALLEDGEEEQDAFEDEIEEEDEEGDFEEPTVVDPVGKPGLLDYIKNRIVLSVGHIVVTLGLEHSVDWVGITLAGIRLEVSNTSHGASNTELKLCDMKVEDRYTRDTCFPVLLQRSNETNGAETHGDTAAKMFASQDDGDEPLIRFRYKKTYREQPQHLVKASGSDVSCTPSSFTGDADEDDHRGDVYDDDGSTARDSPSSTSRPPPIVLENQQPVEGMVESDVFVQLLVQPIKAVVNPELVPLLLAFAMLRNDESIKALGGMVMNEIKEIDDRSSRLMDSLAKIEKKAQEVHRRLQIDIGSIDVMLAQDLCKMRRDTNAVVLRIQGIRLANPEGCEPSPAGDTGTVGRRLATNRMLSTEFASQLFSSHVGSQEFHGEVQQLEVFTCSRDDTQLGICQVLAPVTAPFSVRLANDDEFLRGADAASTAADTPRAQDWLTAELDVDGIQVCVSKKGLSTLVEIGRSTAQTVKKKSFSPSAWGFTSSSDERASSTTESIKKKIEERRKKRQRQSESQSPEPSPSSSPTAADAATAVDAGMPGKTDAAARLAVGWRQKSETKGASRVAARTSGGGALFHGKLKIGVVQLVVDLADDTTGLRDMSGALSKVKVLRQAVKLARSTASSTVRSQVMAAATGGSGLGASTVGLGALRVGVKAARRKGGSNADANEGDERDEGDEGGDSRAAKIRSDILQLEVQNFELSHVIGILALEETTRVRVETVYTLFRGRRHTSRLPIGMAYITKHKPGYSRSRSKTSVWLYNPSSPDSLVPFKKPTDVLSVMAVEDLKEVIPLLRTGMRTGSLVDGFLSLNGIGGDKLFPSEWWQSINELAEATELRDGDDEQRAEASEAAAEKHTERDLQSDLQAAVQMFAATMLGEKMDTLTNFATAALDLKRGQEDGDDTSPVDKLETLSTAAGFTPPPRLLSVVADAQARAMDGTLKQNVEALKAEGEEMLKSQAVGMVQSKVQQISQSLEDQEGTRLQILSSVSSVSPGVTTALEQLQEHLSSGELSKERVMAVLRQGKESVTSEIDEAKTAAVGAIASGGGTPVDWMKQAASRIGDEQMARVRGRLLSQLEPAMRTDEGDEENPHPSAPVVKSVVEGILDASTGMALQMAAMTAARAGLDTSDGLSDDSSAAADAEMATLGLKQNVVVPLLNAIDEEVDRRTQDLLAEQERLKAALAAAEARAEGNTQTV